MTYEFNKKDIENRIEVVEKDKIFKIHYEVPCILIPTLDMLIEEDIGYDDTLIVHDDVNEVKGDKLVGYIVVETDNDYETIFARASQFDMLSKGEDLIVKT